MRKKVEYYDGLKITKQVLKKVRIIELKSVQEGITDFDVDNIKSLSELSRFDKIRFINEHIILGEDWFIHYVKMSYDEIEIKDWVSINKVQNKFEQTMEMFNAMRKILLVNADCKFNAILRHSTSYPFYKKFLDEGYLEELKDCVELDDYSSLLERINEKILEEYGGIEEYLLDLNRERYEKEHFDDNIYHEVVFRVSKKFENRYKKSGR